MRTRIGFAMIIMAAMILPGDGLAIVGGTIDTEHAAAGFLIDGTGISASGVLIDPYWVLTSAGFVDAADGSGFFHVGTDCTSPDASYAISAVFAHPTYYPETGEHNIGLVRLTAPVAGVTPIPCLTNPSGLMAGSTVQYLGYGWATLEDSGNTLRRTCFHMVEEMQFMNFLTYDSDVGPYLGDGGGPALVEFGGTTYVAGVISSIAMDNLFFTVCTRVSAYVPYIESVMEANPPTHVASPHPVRASLRATPNPFNPKTEISFVLDEPSHCRLRIFDARGCLVDELANRSFNSGGHSVVWRGRTDDGKAVPSGVYLAVVQTNRWVQSRRVTLVR